MRRLYLHPQRGWGDSPEGAVMRVDCDLRATPRNQLYRRDERGGWSAITDPAPLSGRERGWRWEVRKARGSDREFLAFRGVALIDTDLISGPLAGLAIHAPGGSPLSNPLNAGEEFWLAPDAAQVFAKRVQAAGGEIARSARRSGIGAVSSLVRLRLETEALLRTDDAAIDAVQRGDMTVLEAFEARGPRLSETVERARSLARDVTAEVERRADSGDPEELRAALADGERAAAELDAIERALVARQRAEAQIAALTGTSSASANAQADIALRIILRELVEIWKREGIAAEIKGDEAVVSLEKGEIRLGRRPAWRPRS